MNLFLKQYVWQNNSQYFLALPFTLLFLIFLLSPTTFIFSWSFIIYLDFLSWQEKEDKNVTFGLFLSPSTHIIYAPEYSKTHIST